MLKIWSIYTRRRDKLKNIISILFCSLLLWDFGYSLVLEHLLCVAVHCMPKFTSCNIASVVITRMVHWLSESHIYLSLEVLATFVHSSYVLSHILPSHSTHVDIFLQKRVPMHSLIYQQLYLILVPKFLSFNPEKGSKYFLVFFLT